MTEVPGRCRDSPPRFPYSRFASNSQFALFSHMPPHKVALGQRSSSKGRDSSSTLQLLRVRGLSE